MLISCEKCSTTYVLDDAVIPPQGAPVQCTRCGHVFTAKHPSAPGAEQSGKLNTGTLMFASPIGSAPPVSSKQPPAPSAVPSQTMVFGAGGPVSSPAAPSASKTVVIVSPTVDVHPPAASPPRRTTQPIGPGTPAAANQTRNAPPFASVAAKQTIIYGGNTPPSAALRSEMVIGAHAANPVEPSQGPGPSHQKTVGFGATEEMPKPASVEQKNQTMMFGRASGRSLSRATAAGSSPADARVPPESSVRIDLEGAGSEGATGDRPKDGHGQSRRSDGKEATPLEAPAAPERRDRTALFAMNPSAEGVASISASLLEVEMSTPPPGLFAGAVDVGEPRREAGLEPMPDIGERGHAPEAASASSKRQQSSPSEAEQRASIEHQQVNLPPDVSRGDEPSALESPESDEDVVAAIRASANRRTTIAVIVFLLIALLIGLALAWYLFGRALVKGDAPRIEQESRAALATLRRDDEASQQAAAAQTRALLIAHPDSVVARSALVIALSFLSDDASAEARRTRTRQAELKARLDALAVDSSLRPSLESQVEQHEGRARAALALSVEREASLRAGIVALDAALTAKNREGAERLAALRARAVAAGVLGEVSALSLAEEFRQSAPGPDNWADLALPEYVCNGGSSFDEALKQLEAVELRDDTFLRAYVLSARIHLIQHNPEGAESQLDRVLAFHPGHDSAKRLQESIVTHARND